jgi:hypothetical protein
VSTRIYVCSRYRADTDAEIELNIRNARVFTRELLLQGYAPFAPHLLYTQVTDEDNPAERGRGLEAATEYLYVCAEMHVFVDERGISEGMRGEINTMLARRNVNTVQKYAVTYNDSKKTIKITYAGRITEPVTEGAK